MPRYFFHTRIGADRVADPDGVELRDPDQAWETARDTAWTLMGRDRAGQSRLLGASLVVTDAAGEVVLEFPFAEAVEPPEDENRP